LLNPEKMRTKDFFKVLQDHGSSELIFEYSPGQKIGANYHITEVKNILVESVDCGGSADSWKETVVQLWENPAEKNKTSYLTTSKAKAIMDRVNRIRPMDMEAVIRFEFGNNTFHTSQLNVQEVHAGQGSVMIALNAEAPLCKAEERCGALTPSIQEEACCDPKSGCC
jgi:hypothetical protein